MNIGDRVWVETSRDRERLGTIVSKHVDNSDMYTVKIDGGSIIYTSYTQLRSASDDARKNDSEKVRLELIPYEGIYEIGRAFTFGAQKYEDHNWANGFKWSRLLGAALRHIVSYLGGEDTDPESGLSHLAHAGACIMMLIAHEQKGLGKDDRRKH